MLVSIISYWLLIIFHDGTLLLGTFVTLEARTILFFYLLKWNGSSAPEQLVIVTLLLLQKTKQHNHTMMCGAHLGRYPVVTDWTNSQTNTTGYTLTKPHC